MRPRVAGFLRDFTKRHEHPTCYACKARLRAGEPLVVAYLDIPHPRGGWLWGRVELHTSCMADEVAVARSMHEGNTTRCEVCEREVTEVFRSFVMDRTRWGLRFCSNSCSRKHRRRRAKPWSRRCRRCHRSIPRSMRADARFCSGACRVAQHRATRTTSSRSTAPK